MPHRSGRRGGGHCHYPNSGDAAENGLTASYSSYASIQTILLNTEYPPLMCFWIALNRYMSEFVNRMCSFLPPRPSA